MKETYLSNAWKTLTEGMLDDESINLLAEVNCRFENSIAPKMLKDGGIATDNGVSYKGFDFQFLEQLQKIEKPTYKMTFSQAIRLLDDFELFGYAEEMNSLLRDIPTLMKVCAVRNGSSKDYSWVFNTLNSEEVILIAPELIQAELIETEPIAKALKTDPIKNLITEKVCEKLNTDKKVADVITLNGLDTILQTFADSLQLRYNGCNLPMYRLDPYEFDGGEKVYVSLHKIVDTVNDMLLRYDRFNVEFTDGSSQVVTRKIQLDYEEVKKTITSEKNKEQLVQTYNNAYNDYSDEELDR